MDERTISTHSNMKKILSLAVICMLGVLALSSCDKKTSDGKQVPGITKSDVDSVSYMIGYYVGMNFKGDDFGPLSGNKIIEGMRAANSGLEIDFMEFQNVINGYMEKRNKIVGEDILKRSESFLADNAKKDGVMITESGLQYKIIREGDGPKPSAQDTVEVNYEGTNLDGKVFDSSYERGQSVTFPLNGVIPGWTEGMQLIGEGGEIMLYIPGELAYGERGASSDIRPNEALTFKVELLSVKPYVEPVEEKK